jgi:hypothetical protein
MYFQRTLGLYQHRVTYYFDELWIFLSEKKFENNCEIISVGIRHGLY